MKSRQLAVWLLVAAAAVVAAVSLRPRIDPLSVDGWSLSRDEAERRASAQLATLGESRSDLYPIVDRNGNELVQARLHELIDAGEDPRRIAGSRLAAMPSGWRASFYDPAETSGRWLYRVVVGPTGEILASRRWWPESGGQGAMEVEEARRIADGFLRRQGVDLRLYSEPKPRFRELESRTDLTLRYVDSEALLGERVEYGIAVEFAGRELAGFAPYVDDPDETEIRAQFQSLGLLQQVWVFLPILLLPLIAIPFVRRYHAGVIGVSRGLQIAAVAVVCGIATMVLSARGIAAGWNFGVLTKPQTTAVIMVQFLVIFFVPMALLSFLSWSVGESICRERRGRLLAAFDGLFRRDWANATFARGALQGVVGGLVVVAVTSLAVLALRPLGVHWLEAGGGPGWSSTEWFAVPLLGNAIAYSLYASMLVELLLVCWVGRRIGLGGGVVFAVTVAALALFPPLYLTPVGASVVVALLANALLVGIFLRWGLLASLLARITLSVVPVSIPLLLADDLGVRVQAALPLIALLLPSLVSLRHLVGGKELVYRYEDVPPHVRRIAERERQKVELETARNIQSSILPDLPPQLAGIEMAHAYLPASEVGGDFYDVLELEDGRLAVAVGDVAGHGVSSGLVMSMAKSALAVQVTFDPEVAAVFRTLNRMVYQSARRRLLTTLCYALVDPARREMFWASAGHLFPYRVTRDGRTQALESVAYPLGVRGDLEVTVKRASLEPGDSLFLFSDGVVESHREQSDEPWGFDRLEASLARHALHGSVAALRDGVLADLRAYVGLATPLEDDLTVLVLRLPDAAA